MGKAPKAGTLGALIAVYFREEHFANLSPRTRADYRKVASFLDPILDQPVFRIDTPLVAGIHDKAAKKIGWRQANMLRTFLSEVFRVTVPKGLIAANYAESVIPKPRPKSRPRANRPWTVAELLTVLEAAPPHVAAAIALMANTGLDPSDALRLRRAAIEGGVIWADRGKTGHPAPIPLHERVAAILAAAQGHGAETILANTRGKTWTYDGFSTVWHRFRETLVDEGAIPRDLTLKGLRHTVATILREIGMSPRQIADLLGQKTESMALHYSRDANLAEGNRKTMDKLQDEIARRTRIVKPEGGTRQTRHQSEA
ncbi:tyrosine-type recombinase/integrase [Cereibacter johrii]|uniref:tyrosine-type recombinase/integrase n=1 Tax=Cereibacter johrii TaxID=445629 RepID=UPI00167E6128|nr:tyrosine-type recombinase/integrase [Cereibacter johrii]